jgi:hypothetical protein
VTGLPCGVGRNVVVLCFLFFWGLFPVACKDSPHAPPVSPTISIAEVDATCTEVWLKVLLKNVSETRWIAIKRDGKRILTTQLVNADSTIIIDSLLPRRRYDFSAELLLNSTLEAESPPIQVATMDTTSHDFVWEIDTLGATASVLYDVAIISDTLAYAVGELYLLDSIGQVDPTRYNAAIWNGIAWEICRVPYYYQGQAFYHPIQTVLAFSNSDIWFAGNGVVHWDGQTYTPVEISFGWGPNRINKMWGNASNDLYVAGEGGAIAHYNGSTWQRVESGTETEIQDLWGSLAENNVMAAVSNTVTEGENRILQITPQGQVVDVPWVISRRVHSLWYQTGKRIFAAGGGVFVRTVDGIWREQTEVPLVYSRRVRGTTNQDVFVAGDFGLVAHYNGIGWRVYPEVNAALYFSCDYSNGLMMAAGGRGGVGIVARMCR